MRIHLRSRSALSNGVMRIQLGSWHPLYSVGEGASMCVMPALNAVLIGGLASNALQQLDVAQSFFEGQW